MDIALLFKRRALYQKFGMEPPRRHLLQVRSPRFRLPRLSRLSWLTLMLAMAVGYLSYTLPQSGRTQENDVSGITFNMCGTGDRYNCVIDGDTFYYQGVRIRIADIDTPETHEPRCAYEADLGDQATHRLRELLNEGPFTLASAERDEDRYGRKLRIVTRNGWSLGETLVSEGLARRWTGRRLPWCQI